MSSEAVAAVWAMRGLEMGERVVLLRLAEVAHPDGSNAFLAVRTIADDAEIDRRTVQRNLGRLLRRGVITEQRAATNKRPTTWRINLAWAQPRPDWPTDEEELEEAPSNVRPIQGRHAAAPNSEPGAALGRHGGGMGAAPVPPDPDPDPDPSERSTRACEQDLPEGVTPDEVKALDRYLDQLLQITPGVGFTEDWLRGGATPEDVRQRARQAADRGMRYQRARSWLDTLLTQDGATRRAGGTPDWEERRQRATAAARASPSRPPQPERGRGARRGMPGG